MGTPRLKIKTELNYRRGYTSRSCNDCNHIVAFRHASDGPVREFRCQIMGVNPGRLYRINPANICDAHDNSRYLKRLKGEA